MKGLSMFSGQTCILHSETILIKKSNNILYIPINNIITSLTAVVSFVKSCLKIEYAPNDFWDTVIFFLSILMCCYKMSIKSIILSLLFITNNLNVENMSTICTKTLERFDKDVFDFEYDVIISVVWRNVCTERLSWRTLHSVAHNPE